jgi:hypothetical protein
MSLLTPEEVERALRFIEAQDWVFAKTVPEQPHWYVMAFATTDRDEYGWFADLIRECGTLRRWKVPDTGRWLSYRYLTLDGWDYWHIARGGPPSMNRRHALPVEE